MVISLKNLKKIWYTIIIFLVVFNPPIIKGISFTTLFCLIGVVCCLLHFHTLSKFINAYGVKSFISTFCLFLVYAMISGLINKLLNVHQSDLIVNNIMSLIVTNISLLVVSFLVVFHTYKENFSLEEVEQLYINAGLIQSILAILCFLSPTVKQFFNNLMIRNSGSEKISRTLRYTSAFRNYGFASTLYDIFGFTMSILALLAFIKGVRGDKKQFISFVAMAFTGIINARTSVVILAIGIVIVYAKERNCTLSGKQFLKLILTVSLGTILIYIVYGVLTRKSSQHSTWILSGLMEIITLFSGGGTTGYFDTLFNEFLFLPDDIESLFWGTGMTPEQAVLVNSDVGYIQNIWQFGIMGSILIYYMYLILFKKMNNILSGKVNCSLAYVFGVLIAVYLIKLNPLGYSQASVVFLPISFFALYNSVRVDSIY